MESYYHILFDNLSEEQLEQKKLGDLVTIVGGGAPSTECPEYWTKSGEGIPWIGIRDLTSNKGKFINKGEIDITETGKKNSSTKLIPEGTILFSCWGTIGKMAINDKSLCLSRSLFAFLKESSFERNYYWFLIKCNLLRIKVLSQRSVMNGISQKNLKEFLIDLPPQELISHFNQICEHFFQLQKTNEREIRELLKLQQYFIDQTN